MARVRNALGKLGRSGATLCGVWLVRSGLEDVFGVGTVARVLFWFIMFVFAVAREAIAKRVVRELNKFL